MRLCAQIDPKTLPVRQQGYSAAFDMEFMNGSRLKIAFFICYSVPRRIATETGHKYEWELVTRDHCKNGCPVRHTHSYPLPTRRSSPYHSWPQALAKADQSAWL